MISHLWPPVYCEHSDTNGVTNAINSQACASDRLRLANRLQLRTPVKQAMASKLAIKQWEQEAADKWSNLHLRYNID